MKFFILFDPIGKVLVAVQVFKTNPKLLLTTEMLLSYNTWCGYTAVEYSAIFCYILIYSLFS
jgi:hypothetical protein